MRVAHDTKNWWTRDPQIFPIFLCLSQMGLISSMLACKQTLRDALAAWGKGGRAFNYVSGIWISTSKKSMKILIGRDDISNDVTTLGTCLNMFFNVCLHSLCLVPALGWLAKIWQLSRRGAIGEFEAEFKSQRRSCKLSFLFPPHCQSVLESLLTGSQYVG